MQITCAVDAMIFDFDGVLVDSVDIKTKAFALLVEGHKRQDVDAFIDYHLQNGGVSRVKKIEYFYEHILREELSDKQLEDLCGKFSKLVIDAVVNADYLPGAEAFLEEFSNKTKCFVVSGTPEEEIRQIVQRRNMSRYFVEVLGSPVKKNEHVKNIIQKYRLNPERIIFFGDAPSDYRASMEHGLYFVGVMGQESALRQFNGFIEISNFAEGQAEIKELLERLSKNA